MSATETRTTPPPPCSTQAPNRSNRKKNSKFEKPRQKKVNHVYIFTKKQHEQNAGPPSRKADPNEAEQKKKIPPPELELTIGGGRFCCCCFPVVGLVPIQRHRRSGTGDTGKYSLRCCCRKCIVGQRCEYWPITPKVAGSIPGFLSFFATRPLNLFLHRTTPANTS